MVGKTTFALGALALAAGAEAHSFLIKVGNGYPRNFEVFDMAGDGYTHRPGGKPGVPCGQSLSYSSKYPMATASAGATINLTWPARNHGPNNLPGRTVQIYHGTSNGPYNTLVGETAFCPGGPSGNDAPCNGSFKVPSGLSGVQSFQWWWEFNGGEYYSTCFEVNLGGSSGGNTGGGQQTTTRQQTTTTTTRQSGGQTTTTTRASSGGGSGAALYGQCGGQGWSGPTTCASGTCRSSNQYYSQCLP